MTSRAIKADYNDTIANSFICSLQSAEHRTSPYDHWMLKDILPSDIAHEMAALPFAPPEEMVFNGTREANNSKRVYFTKENQDKFAVCRDFVDAFDSADVKSAIHKITGADIADALLRVEYCQDTGEFWLEPHTDISVKKFTFLIYLSQDPALSNCGTDVYDTTPEHKFLYSAPYAMNHGFIFVPGKDTWHGFSKRTINGTRKTLIVNYVSKEWRDTWELAY